VRLAKWTEKEALMRPNALNAVLAPELARSVQLRCK
jgi:hypothetical protein